MQSRARSGGKATKGDNIPSIFQIKERRRLHAPSFFPWSTECRDRLAFNVGKCPWGDMRQLSSHKVRRPLSIWQTLSCSLSHCSVAYLISRKSIDEFLGGCSLAFCAFLILRSPTMRSFGLKETIVMTRSMKRSLGMSLLVGPTSCRKPKVSPLFPDVSLRAEYDSQEEEEHDLTRQRQNKKWEKKWERKFQSLYHNLPHRGFIPLIPSPFFLIAGVSARPENFTDAILACPGCFTTICEMCQQHRSMFNRWRALEVSNSCKVLKDQPQIDEVNLSTSKWIYILTYRTDRLISPLCVDIVMRIWEHMMRRMFIISSAFSPLLRHDSDWQPNFSLLDWDYCCFTFCSSEFSISASSFLMTPATCSTMRISIIPQNRFSKLARIRAKEQ